MWIPLSRRICVNCTDVNNNGLWEIGGLHWEKWGNNKEIVKNEIIATVEMARWPAAQVRPGDVYRRDPRIVGKLAVYPQRPIGAVGRAGSDGERCLSEDTKPAVS